MKKMRDEYISKQDAVDTIPKERIVEYMDEFGAGFNSCRNEMLRTIEAIKPADVVPVNREKLMAVLRNYFSIGDSFTYELTRVKSAFEVGTMSLDDFEEWGEENISDLCDYIFRELRKESEHG